MNLDEIFVTSLYLLLQRDFIQDFYYKEVIEQWLSMSLTAAQIIAVNFKTPINITAYLVKVSFFLFSNHSHLFQAENNKTMKVAAH